MVNLEQNPSPQNHEMYKKEEGNRKEVKEPRQKLSGPSEAGRPGARSAEVVPAYTPRHFEGRTGYIQKGEKTGCRNGKHCSGGSGISNKGSL